ncbi:MAG: restriction endonuclease subunit S [Methanobrevibacter ruminantium]|nr:restriction endonuclease subunit S [Methanobrevibacter ruminantium]
MNGFTPKRSNPEFWENGNIPWFTVSDIHKQGRVIHKTEQFINSNALSKNSNRILPENTVLLCCTASVGEYAITKIPLTTNQQFNGLKIRELYKTVINPEFLFELCPSFKIRLLKIAGKTTFNFISVSKLKNLIIPIPPINEQIKIVSKLNELIDPIEVYDKYWNNLEELNENFPKKIKDSILQEAIQGMLVPQDSNDESASVLLKRIKEEKEQLIKAKKIKRNKNESVIFKENNHFYEKIGKNEPICIDDEIPFNIPNSWEWCRLNTVVTILGDGIHGTPNYDDNGDYYFINGNNLNNGEITIKENTKKVNYEEYLKHYRELNENTVLVSINGTIGNIAFYNNEKVMLGKSACYFNLFKRILKNYIKILVESDYFMKYALNSATGTTIKNVSLKSMKNWLIPIPPYEEQKRIVRKIEDLELYRK